jgi:cell division protein FtsQ
MTAARIARGGAAAARRAPAKRSGPAPKRRAKTKPPGLLDGLPISPATLRKLGLWGALLTALIVAIATLLAFRVPQRIGTAIGEQVGAAGFSVSRVELRGLGRIDPAQVTKVALDQPSLAMPLLDLDAVRAKLMSEFRWIKEARVSRRLPDTLVVDIVERSPAAVWQLNGRLQLVDGEGHALEPVRPDAMPANLPLVIGPGAQHRIAPLGTLLGNAPQLREQIVGASWIGGRRWDLRFRTGETLSLPEGDEPARAAFRRFAELAGRNNVLGRNFLRFDMRVEGKMIVQRRTMPAEGSPAAASAPPAQSRPPAPQPPQDLSRTI